jgi:hypothetical protein
MHFQIREGFQAVRQVEEEATWGGERARFLEEESEPRTKGIFLAGENHRADVSACLTVSLSRIWKCFHILVAILRDKTYIII